MEKIQDARFENVLKFVSNTRKKRTSQGGRVKVSMTLSFCDFQVRIKITGIFKNLSSANAIYHIAEKRAEAGNRLELPKCVDNPFGYGNERGTLSCPKKQTELGLAILGILIPFGW